MRKIFLTVWAIMICLFSAAQDDEILRAAVYLSGASTEEDADESWIYRLESAGKIRVNSDRLRPGILTDYQVASIKDYRARSGDILSSEELAMVDGFSHDAVEVLRPFLSFESRRLPGQTDTSSVKASALVRTTLSTIGAKARAEWKDYRAGAAWRGSDGTFYADLDTRAGRLVAGDMNLRYGSGLALWSGFSMESLSTVDAFIRRGGGISPVWSYNSSLVHRGVAYEYSGTHFGGAAFWCKNIYGAHAEYLWLHGKIGLTVTSKSISTEFDYNFRGTVISAEAALRSGRAAGILSARRKGAAVQVRAISSAFSGRKYGEYALAGGYAGASERRVALSGKSGFGSSVPFSQYSVTVDAALLPIPQSDPRRLQIRAYGNLALQLSPSWALALRLTERYRNYEAPRTDLRADVRYGSGPWIGVFRAEAVRCSDWGFLSYAEGGRKTEKSALYLRLSGFYTGSWNSRIYVYERDAPGTFSVPAYSGRGLSASVVGSVKARIRRMTLKGNLRAAAVFRIGRTPAWTLNFQLHSGL